MTTERGATISEEELDEIVRELRQYAWGAAQKAADAIAQLRRERVPPETAWLVELQSDGRFRGWIKGWNEDNFGWTIFPHEALRFCRKVDADAFRARFGFMGSARSCTHLSTEHIWPDSEAT